MPAKPSRLGDGFDLDFSDEGPRGEYEVGVTLGDGAHADERPAAEPFANQFKALAGDEENRWGQASSSE